MSANARLLVGFGFVEVCLAALWFWLANAATESSTRPDAQVVIGQIMGGAMGIIFGLGCAIFLVRRFKRRG